MQTSTENDIAVGQEKQLTRVTQAGFHHLENAPERLGYEPHEPYVQASERHLLVLDSCLALGDSLASMVPKQSSSWAPVRREDKRTAPDHNLDRM